MQLLRTGLVNVVAIRAKATRCGCPFLVFFRSRTNLPKCFSQTYRLVWVSSLHITVRCGIDLCRGALAQNCHGRNQVVKVYEGEPSRNVADRNILTQSQKILRNLQERVASGIRQLENVRFEEIHASVFQTALDMHNLLERSA